MIATTSRYQPKSRWQENSLLHLDWPLLIGLGILAVVGLFTIYSAGNQNVDIVISQATRLGIGFVAMLLVAQLNLLNWTRWIPWLYLTGVILLIAVLIVGDSGKGAQRWLDLGFVRFQPSELMKLLMPMMVAWFLSDRPLPSTLSRIGLSLIIIIVPTALITVQPDLGTSLLIAASGIFVVLMSGLSWRIIAACFVGGVSMIAIALFTPVLTYILQPYQVQRVNTFLNPEAEPLGAGYHIIQSKIAIGSGGLYGKGWLNGTQSNLAFLPERTTDFIFAVFSEEFGLVGVALLLTVYFGLISRGLYIAVSAQNTFERLLAATITLTFFVYLFVNIGMVSGILPVVGVPLPLISFGGTSMVTILMGFGLLMSIHTHKRLLSAQ
ncbi:MAG: rod shape-determining protein RodA [Pseudomonadota bacterium]